MRTSLYCFIAIGLISICSCNPTPEQHSGQVMPVFKLNSMTFIDSLGSQTEMELIKAFEKVNMIISDSLGYPGAGYSIWKVQADTLPHLRYLVRGSWPDM